MVATIAIIEKLIVDISKSVNEYATIYVASDMMGICNTFHGHVFIIWLK